MDKRDIRVTRTLNKLVFVIILLVLISFIFQVSLHLIKTGKILPHSIGMLATFLPLSIVFYLNEKRKYFYARLWFILLPLITTVLWMFVGSSQSGQIHYTFLIFPIPIFILFKKKHVQAILIIILYVSFLSSHAIITYFPASIDSYSNPYFSLILFGILISLSFVMLLFFVSEMDEAEQRLQKKNIELEEFSKIASHDMREPLRTISNFASLIKKKHGVKVSNEISEYIEYIESGVGRLDILLSDLSNYSTIDSTEESLKDVDLNIILENVKDDLKLAIQKSGAIVKSNSLPTIRIRRSQISQVFQNLLHNSIKFQSLEKANKPKINIESQFIDGFHHVTFHDNGIGIKEEYLDQIFLKFKRLHSRDKYEGTGLGLATCKRIVEKYNGEIDIKSNIGVGTSITLKFMSNK